MIGNAANWIAIKIPKNTVELPLGVVTYLANNAIPAEKISIQIACPKYIINSCLNGLIFNGSTKSLKLNLAFLSETSILSLQKIPHKITGNPNNTPNNIPTII